MKFLAWTSLILLCDQLSKQWVLQSSDLPWWLIPDEVGIRLVFNEGIAFSLPLTGWLSIVFSAIIIVVLAGYAYHSLNREHLTALLTGMVLGGGLGNLIDRLYRGAVVDFIQIGEFPVFNVADVAITGGFLLIVIFFERLQKIQKV